MDLLTGEYLLQDGRWGRIGDADHMPAYFDAKVPEPPTRQTVQVLAADVDMAIAQHSANLLADYERFAEEAAKWLGA